MALIKRLFYDIETSPNIGFFWKSGYKLNISHENIIHERAIICICYKWEGERQVHHLEWNKGCDKKMVAEFVNVANEADELIGHNGDRFDLKWINTRILYHGMDPSSIDKTVDTLKIAKAKFNFNSNRLDYLGKYLLGHGKIETSYSMWKDIVLQNCPKAMANMVKYCKADVKLLEDVWKVLEPFTQPKTHTGVMGGLDKWTCPWTGDTNVAKHKTRVTARGTTQHQMQSKSRGAYYSISEKAYAEYLEYKESERQKKRKAKSKQ